MKKWLIILACLIPLFVNKVDARVLPPDEETGETVTYLCVVTDVQADDYYATCKDVGEDEEFTVYFTTEDVTSDAPQLDDIVHIVFDADNLEDGLLEVYKEENHCEQAKSCLYQV